jgi:hypothetical protein
MNDHLLSTLAKQGRGAYHFIDSVQEMDKVFRKEVEGLVERVANDVRVSILPAPGVQLISVTGFEGQPPSSGAQVLLQDMGSGDSQVVIARLQVSSGSLGSRALAKITLSFSDVFAQRDRETIKGISATVTEMGAYDPLADIEVLRNGTIVRMAESLKEIDRLFNTDRYEEAWMLAYAMEQELRSVAAMAADPTMLEDADLFQRYQITLATALGYDPALEDGPTPLPNQDQPQRWGPSGETPLPSIEID